MYSTELYTNNSSEGLNPSPSLAGKVAIAPRRELLFAPRITVQIVAIDG